MRAVAWHRALLFVVSLFAAGLACAAQVVGTVTHLSGPLLAKKADGVVKILSQKSPVEQGDTLVSEKDTYARIKFIDNSEITMRPNSQLKIDDFSFDEDKPEKDSAKFDLVKGGLRAVTGTLGKRSKEKFGMNTPTATIGIRGTIFIVEYIPPDQPEVAAYGMASMAAVTPSAYASLIDGVRSDVPLVPVPLEVLPLRLAQTTPGAGGLSPGLYVSVIDGAINLSNRGGSQNFSAGQFGYTASNTKAPVVLPSNPGIKFTPPATFSSSTTGTQGTASNNSKAKEVDCEVR